MSTGYKTFTAGDTLAAADVKDYLMLQSVMTFASSTARDTALSGVLREGLYAYTEDDGALTAYDGSSWNIALGAKTAWTPSWTNVTQGSSPTNVGWYWRINGLTYVVASLTLGTGGSFTGSASISNLPVSVTLTTTGIVDMIDATGPTQFFGDCRFVASSTTANIHARTVSGSLVASGSVNGTTPFTWTTSDKITVSGWYL